MNICPTQKKALISLRAMQNWSLYLEYKILKINMNSNYLFGTLGVTSRKTVTKNKNGTNDLLHECTEK